MTQKMGRVLGLSAALLALLAAVLVLWPAAPTQAQPAPPHRVAGRATLDGQPAAGATINAVVGGTTCGTATADASGNYRLDILSSGERSGCGSDGATVTFTVGGARASQTLTWRMGDIQGGFDLTAVRGTATPTATATATAPPATPTVTATATAPATATATATAPATATATATAPPATATAAPTTALPRTGTGGGPGSSGWLALTLAGLAVLGAGSVLALRRMRG